MPPPSSRDRADAFAPIATSRRLTICAVSPVFCHPTWQGSGMARTATGLLIALARRGHRVTVISPLHDLDRTFARPHETSLYDGDLTLLYSSRARPTRFGTSAHGLDELLAPRLRTSDLAYFHGFLSPWIDRAATMAKGAHVPYVIQDHGKLTPSIVAHRAIVKRLYLELRGRALLRGAARVLASTASLAEALTTWDARVRWGWCTNGLDASEFDRAPPPRPIEAPYVLSLAYLDPRKNPAFLIRAFDRVARARPTWKLALVGPDNFGLGAELRALVRARGLEDRVVMPGHVDGDERLAWLKHASLFAMPSSGEGLSLAMLEALACGVPCLVSPESNCDAIAERRAGEIVPLDERAWGEALARWVDDDARRADAGARARALFVERHTLEAVGERLEAILIDALGDRRRA